MGFNSVLTKFQNKKLALEQRQTARLNNKRLKLKAKYEREKVKDKNRMEITKYEKGLSKFKDNKRGNAFGNKVRSNVQKRSQGFTKTNPIYASTSGTNPYDFSGSTKKKPKKKRGKTITIRL